MKIEETIDRLIKREGGYVDHPSDKGGPTMYGITEHVARANGYEGPMQSLPLDLAKAIYRARYWLDPKFAQVAMLSPEVAEEMLDTGVNMGPMRASKFLQRALNVLNQGLSTYPNMEVDGVIGKMTLHALKQFLAKRGTDGTTVLLRALNAQQGAFYMEIAEGDAKQEDFMFGWFLQRVGDLG